MRWIIIPDLDPAPVTKPLPERVRGKGRRHSPRDQTLGGVWVFPSEEQLRARTNERPHRTQLGVRPGHIGEQ